MHSHPNPAEETAKRAWKGLVATSALLPALLDSELQKSAKLTYFEFQVLEALAHSSDNTLRLSSLAATTNTTLPRLSHVITRMEKRGLVERTACPEDRRATNAVLTSEGAELYSGGAASADAAVQRYILGALSPTQVDSLAQILELITSALRESPECRAVSPQPESA